MEIKISEVLTCLKEGYTRTKADKNYDSEIGSIQEKYSLNGIQVFELFKHDKLKGKKTIIKKEPAFTIIDDTNGEVPEVAAVIEEVVEEIEEVSTPDTPTLTDINDSTTEETIDKVDTNEETEDVVEPVEPTTEGNPW